MVSEHSRITGNFTVLTFIHYLEFSYTAECRTKEYFSVSIHFNSTYFNSTYFNSTQFHLTQSIQLNSMTAIKPRITVGLPDKQILEQDQSVSLRCLAAGQPSPSLTWWADGKEVTGKESRYTIATKITSSGGVQSLLTIQGLRMSDSAIYACKADNKAGIAVTSSDIAVRGMSKKYDRGAYNRVTKGRISQSRRILILLLFFCFAHCFTQLPPCLRVLQVTLYGEVDGFFKASTLLSKHRIHCAAQSRN